MSIKEELEKLREEQYQLEKKIKEEEYKKSVEIKNLQETQESLSKFIDKKSELAKKIYEEFYQKSKEIEDKIKRINEKIKKLQNENEPIKNRIHELCTDKSLYIKEQVDYLILEFMNYVEENERRLGEKIINKFTIKPCRVSRSMKSCHYKHNGLFEIEEDGLKRIAITKDYCFDDGIRSYTDDGYCVLSDWYKKYENDFIKSFLESLKNSFHSKNFKVVDVNNRLGEFTIELI